MFKIVNTIIFLSAMIFFNTNAYGETKRDCSIYSIKTFSGLADRMRCKKGLPPREKRVIKKFSDANPLKPKNETPKRELACHEYSTKNFVDLIAKLKCEKKWGYK